MTRIDNVKKVKNYLNKYFSIESAVLKNWSLEDLAEEVETYENAEYEDGSSTEETSFMDEDGFMIDGDENSPNVENDVVSDSEDIDPNEYMNREDDVDLTIETNENDVVNLMELGGTLMNTYLKNMSNVYTQNKKCIETTGNFKENALYEKFIVPAQKIIEMYSKDTQLEKKINNFMSVILDKKKMSAVVGTTQSPFIYESLQLLCIELFRELLAVLPMSIKQGTSIEDTVNKLGYVNVTKLIECSEDIVEISNLFGEKIYFMEPDEAKELTGRNEAINSTPYAQNIAFESMSENYDVMLKTLCATESILNLIEIRNNKALLEFSLVIKLCILISKMVEDVNLTASCNSVLADVNDLLTKDATKNDEELSESVDAIANKLRGEVIMPQLNKLADVQSDTEADLSLNNNTNN